VFPKSGCLPKSHLAHQVDWPQVVQPVAQRVPTRKGMPPFLVKKYDDDMMIFFAFKKMS